MRIDPKERFMQKVEKSDGCWKWKSAFGSRGYGIFWVGGKKRNEMAHRYSYMIHKGEIPDGMVVMHSCDNPACVNPDHLSVGTSKENTHDACAKRRKGRGETASGSKPVLSELSVQRMRIAFGALTLKRIAELLGVSVTAVKNVSRGRNWKHIHATTKQALA